MTCLFDHILIYHWFITYWSCRIGLIHFLARYHTRSLNCPLSYSSSILNVFHVLIWATLCYVLLYVLSFSFRLVISTYLVIG